MGTWNGNVEKVLSLGITFIDVVHTSVTDYKLIIYVLFMFYVSFFFPIIIISFNN